MPAFRFKQFTLEQHQKVFKVGTDGILLGAWADTLRASNVLDVGTGTGLIASMIAQKTPETTTITGIDPNESAFLLASENIANSPWKNRLRILHTTLSDFTINYTSKFDLIVSNPPYFNAGILPEKQESKQSRHTISLSHEGLIKDSKSILSENGSLSLILPYAEGQEFIRMALKQNLHLHRLTEVRSRPQTSVERLLMSFSTHAWPLVQNELVIYDQESGSYSDEYVELTKDFYLNM
ncbi:MAG: methyltransferase [Bacteroidota bacterium]